MSKKKATMTLKDFHGGSIPSDLRLPSAPGVTVRPIDRPSFDRQMSWGNSSGKPDHRVRPASAGSSRNLDEKTPFFSHSSHIGRNFDEDERKPLDGMSGPRRTIGDEILRVHPIRVVEHAKVDSPPGSRSGTRASSISLSQSGSTASSYAGRISEVHSSARLNNQTYGGNAWGVKKEATSSREQAVSWSAPDAETKLAHASALEKISSGRWNSKQLVHSPKDAEAEFGYSSKKTYSRPETVDSYERNTYVTSANVLQPIHYNTGKSSGPDFMSAVPSESSERPKLKLLPRSKPVENVESPTDCKQTSNHLHVEDNYVVHEAKNPLQADSAALVASDRAIERPKLNLKPRSQTPEQLEVIESKRGTVFGGARPRELVLKARGVEDDVSSYDSPSSLRVKENLPKADTSAQVSPSRHSEKAETNPANQRTTKYPDRRDHHLDSEKNDSHRRNNRQSETRKNNNNNNIYNNNNNNQLLQQQKQERPPSPDTWRKPVEPNDAPPTRYGKAASAVELAQAFSKSVSTDSTAADRLLGSRGGQGRGQIPFSRLTGPSTRPQINGY